MGSIHSAFRGYGFQFETWPNHITIRKNMVGEFTDLTHNLTLHYNLTYTFVTTLYFLHKVSEAWVDLIKGVETNEISVFTLDGTECRDKFLDSWGKLEDHESVGISTRWALVIGDDQLLKLQLQALPAPACLLNDKPTLRADNVPVISLLELPVSCEMFDGDQMAGPVPTLFGEDEEATLTSLTMNLSTVHSDLQKLARRCLSDLYHIVTLTISITVLNIYI
jgi:hypothetical protein